MGFTRSEIGQLAITFPEQHADQIAAKAARYQEPRDDVLQDVSAIILELGQRYDPAKGTFEQFIFGHLEMRSRRRICPLRFAISIDQTNNNAVQTRALVESLPAECEEKSYEGCGASNAPWAKTIRAIIDLISGKSSDELAQHMGVTTRRVRQIFQRLCEAEPGSIEFEKGMTTLHARLLKCDL